MSTQNISFTEKYGKYQSFLAVKKRLLIRSFVAHICVTCQSGHLRVALFKRFGLTKAILHYVIFELQVCLSSIQSERLSMC